MKVLRLLVGSLVLTFVLTVSAFAQTEKPQTVSSIKIAVINTEAFGDKTNGIQEVVDANDKLDTEFKPLAEELNLIAEKIKKLEKELKDAAGMIESPRDLTKEMIDGKVNEYESAVEKYKKRQDEIKSLYDKRKPEIFADIYKKVGEAIKQFAKEKGFIMILDRSKIDDGLITDLDNDITKEFIKYYNEDFVKREK